MNTFDKRKQNNMKSKEHYYKNRDEFKTSVVHLRLERQDARIIKNGMRRTE